MNQQLSTPGNMEMYHQLEDKHKSQTMKRVLICLLITTCILLVAAVIVAGIMHAHIQYFASNTTDDSDYCTTSDCLKLASEISSSINESVDPCDDFYHYACDGWADEYSWTEINVQSYGQFSNVFKGEKEAFLDAMFYKTKDSLVDHSSVEKAQAFFTTCQDSTVDMEELEESEFFAILKNMTTFATADTWDSAQQEAFHDSLVYLTQINYNSLFQLRSAGAKTPAFIQYVGLWQLYAAVGNGSYLISSVFEPLYMEHFGLNASEAKSMAKKVAAFADDVSAISTVTESEYYDRSAYFNMFQYANFSDYASTDTAYLNYTRLVYEVYGVESSTEAPTQRLYLSGGVSFFEGLSNVISSHSPQTVEMYLISSILYYWVNFKDTYSQSNYEDRTDFCFDRTLESFPFVYGYIIYNTVYDDEKHEIASSMTQHIKDAGVKALIEDASWLDEFSRAAALKKIENMALYIGFPTDIKEGDKIDRYYRDAEQDDTVSWMVNLESMTKWDYITQNATFWNNSYSLTSDWPDIFADESGFPYWLTGINAFYVPSENFFTIPATISQPPFLDGDSEYPSAVAYGGLGVVCGHEMSHGFDPNGASYNWNGTYVGSIFSNESNAEYQDKMACLINQYDNIVVETLPSGQKVYGDGNLTITENVADNAGVWSAWVAWKAHVAENGEDKLLYGVDMSQEQLFFLGYARLWCETARPGASANWTDVHSQHYARVVAPLQNNEHFATAYGCKSGSFMNPENKCSVW